MNTDARESLHGFLKEYMAVQNKYINRLVAGEAGTVYICRVLQDHDWYDCGEIFSDYEKCLEHVRSEYPAAKSVHVIKQWLN